MTNQWRAEQTGSTRSDRESAEPQAPQMRVASIDIGLRQAPLHFLPLPLRLIAMDLLGAALSAIFERCFFIHLAFDCEAAAAAAGPRRFPRFFCLLRSWRVRFFAICKTETRFDGK